MSGVNVLLVGKLHAQPEPRTSKAGKQFVSAKLRVSNGEEVLFAGIVAFSESACAALLALDAGDAVAVSGSATVKAWIDREGQPRPNLDVVADVVLTAYGLGKRRAAVAVACGEPRREKREQRDDGFDGADDAWLEGKP